VEIVFSGTAFSLWLTSSLIPWFSPCVDNVTLEACVQLLALGAQCAHAVSLVPSVQIPRSIQQIGYYTWNWEGVSRNPRSLQNYFEKLVTGDKLCQAVQLLREAVNGILLGYLTREVIPKQPQQSFI
jgi:hypothetical protein